MKYPLWILNLSLLILVASILGFIFFTRQKPPTRENIEPGVVAPLQGEVVKINISKIYENDLFGTYRREHPTHEPVGIPTAPEAPMARRLLVPPLPTPQFLDPLNISLKGIIIMHDDSKANRVIIADNKTNQEATYRVGQSIEDAQVIQILSNKVVLLRSNGQQEVLYLREKDAQRDPVYIAIDSWDDVVQKLSDTMFNISPSEFVQRVKNLGQFIDMLDLITIYKQGKNFGCRVGNLEEKSLGRALGLEKGDTIMTINDIPVADTPNRIKIYKAITAMKLESTITVKILRHGRDIDLRYILKEFKTPKATPAQVVATPEDIKEQQLKMLQEKHKFAPTLKEIREQEKRNMLQKGKAPSSTPQNTNDE